MLLLAAAQNLRGVVGERVGVVLVEQPIELAAPPPRSDCRRIAGAKVCEAGRCDGHAILKNQPSLSSGMGMKPTQPRALVTLQHGLAKLGFGMR